mgnify:FL=1
MFKRILTLALSAVVALPASAQVTIGEEAMQRASELVAKMTLEEKIDLIAGDADGFHIYGVPRLRIPEIRTADGPQGLRNDTQSTMYPCGIALASCWNRSLALAYGKSIGSDARARGVHILLGPGVNIYRAPMCGRNFEYYGEDPFLTSETAVQYILGVQSEGVMATVKHFCGNNQEWSRHHTSSDIDERTLNEIYFPAFRKAVQVAGVGSVMSSYNLLNSVHTSENEILVRILREKWGFEGIYMSDWAATYSTVGAANAGLDLEMPVALYFTRELLGKAVENGTVRESVLDEKCRHILQTFIAFGFLDREQKDESLPLDNPESNKIALDVAREAVVLLKNDGILPLCSKSHSKAVKNIVVLGPNAECVPTGGGSGFVNPYHTKSVFVALSKQGKKLKVSLVPFTGKIDVVQPDFTPEQKAAIRCADAVIYCGGFNSDIEHEDGDRPFDIPAAQTAQMHMAAELNPNLIIVINAGGGVRLTDLDDISRAILMAWYPGQAGGQAIAEILTGATNPSGHLPISIEARPEDNPTFGSYYENVFRNLHSLYSRVCYSEGVFVGYRGYERNGVRPLYPFGFGLSYTTFGFSDLGITPSEDGKLTVSFRVRNTGKRDGATAAQVYVSECSPTLAHPEKELKGYEKIFLKSGEVKEISIVLDDEAFSHYDTALHDFIVTPGEYRILVGDSSLNLPLNATVQR